MRSRPAVGCAGTVANGNAPRDGVVHSLVLASDYRVDDVDHMWALIAERRSPLAAIGAHHVVLYEALFDPGRVLVTMGIRHRQSVTEVLRSPAVFEWFDLAGVNDLPAVFAGEVLEKIDLDDGGTDPVPAGVIVGAVSVVPDVSALMAKVHGGLQRFTEAGVRKVWVYRACDDRQEVLTLLELDNLTSAQRWIDEPDVAAEWMAGAGIGGYPSLFVGQLAHVMTLPEPRDGTLR